MISTELKRTIEECILNSDDFGNHIRNTHDTDWTPVVMRDEIKIISMNEYKNSYIIILCKLNEYINDRESKYKEELCKESFVTFVYDTSKNRLYYNEYDALHGAGLNVGVSEGEYIEPDLSRLNLK